MKTITYLKQTITKNEGVAGYALPYSVYMNGQFFYSDSLSGIKQIIWSNFSEICNNWKICSSLMYPYAMYNSKGERIAYANTLKDARAFCRSRKA